MIKQNVTPIWHNFPAVFLYGFRWQPLLLAVSMSILIALAGDGLLGWAVFMILYAMLFKYSFVALQRTAEGNMRPPPLDGEVLAGEYDLPLKLYGVLLLFALAVNSIGNSVGPLAGGLFALFGLLVFPASIMLLAVTESFTDAINPLLLLRLIIDIRWSYLALYGLLFLLTIAQSNMISLLDGKLPPSLVAPVMLFLMVYFTLLTFHIMGYILYQNHETLGHRVEQDDKETDLEDQRLIHFEGMMAAGHKDAAIAELRGLLKEYPGDLDIRRRLHQLLVVEQQCDWLGKHSRRYLPLLLKAGQEPKAVDVYLDCGRLGVTCSLDSADDHYQLARALSRSGQHTAVVKLLNGLHKCFPESETIPQAYLLTARTLCEQLNQDELAVKVLKFVLKRYPQHPLVPEVQAYLEAVERLAK